MGCAHGVCTWGVNTGREHGPVRGDASQVGGHAPTRVGFEQRRYGRGERLACGGGREHLIREHAPSERVEHVVKEDGEGHHPTDPERSCHKAPKMPPRQPRSWGREGCSA